MGNKTGVTPNFWREKITDSLDMQGGKKRLHLASRKIGVNHNIFHLVIGLGGSGLKALLETKGLIEQTCENPGSRVAYLALDTSQRDLKDTKSSPETGAVSLNSQESMMGLLTDAGLKGLFAPMYVDNTVNTYPEIFTWADERIDPPGDQTGASGTRQIARLVLTKNYNNVITAISQLIQGLNTNQVTVQNAQLYVYVISGIGGGTGSGTFMDIPYLVRDAIRQAGYSNRSQLFGYIFTPDVNFGNGSNEEMLKRNGYAALQELDYNLQIPGLREEMRIYYPGKVYTAGGAGDQFFDKIHMITATTNENIAIENPLAHGSRAIAQSILSFVAAEQVTQGNQFTVSDYYSNLTRIADNLVGTVKDPHRFHKYIAIGSAEFELPIDDIMMYVATLLFEKMEGMISAESTKADIDGIERVLKLDMGSLFDSLRRNVPFAANMPQQMSFDGIVKDKEYWKNQSMAAYNTVAAQASAVASVAVDAVLQDRTDSFDRILQSLFVDSDKGPVFANHVIVGSDDTDGLLKRLLSIRRDLQDNWLNFTPQNFPLLANNVQAYDNMTMTMEKGLPIFGKREEEANRANRINTVGNQIFTKSVCLALAPLLDRVCEKLYEYIEKKNANLFEMVVTILECMNKTFKSNGNILTDGKKEVKPGGQLYTWGSLDVPTVSYYVRERFDRIIGPNTQNMVDSFVKELWQKADSWVNDPNQFDPVSFISALIDNQFNQIAQISIEDILADLLATPGTNGDLQSGIVNNLMPWLEGQSRPLYSPENRNPNVKFPVWHLISVPKDCTNVYKIIGDYCAGKFTNTNMDGYNLQASNIRTRIYMQTVTCGLPLSEFKIVEQLEEEYARKRDQAVGSEGLHLVHNVKSAHGREKKTWNDLYTLIPRCVRPKMQYSPDVKRLLDEEDERKELFRELIENGSPMMHLRRPGNDPWDLDVDITVPSMRISNDGTTLEWVEIFDKTKGRETVHRSWSCGGSLKNIQAVRTELAALKQNGLGTLENGRMKTFTVRGSLIYDQISGALDESRTWDYLLENCQCRLELVYSVRAEKVKYETLDAFLATLDKAYAENMEAQMDAEMGDFAKLLLKGYITLGTDPLDFSHFFKVRDYDGVTRKLTSLPLSATMQTPETYFKLYQAYSAIINSPSSNDAPTQRVLTGYLAAFNNAIGSDVSKLSTAVKDQLLDDISALNVAGKLQTLLVTQNVSDDVMRFYRKLNANIEVLKGMLSESSDSFLSPAPKLSTQSTVVWEEI